MYLECVFMNQKILFIVIDPKDSDVLISSNLVCLQAADRELPLPVQQSQHQGGYLVGRTLR